MDLKPLVWIGSSRRDLSDMPEDVRRDIGFALYLAQLGQKAVQAKVMRGFGSAGVLEIVEHDAGGTYRAVYTVRFSDAVYVLHCFQKKSKAGIATPKTDLDLIASRLRDAKTLSERPDNA